MSTSTPKSNPLTAGPDSKLDETKHEAKSAAQSMAADAKSAARDAADNAKAQVQAHADDAKHGVADEVNNVAKALRKAADASRTGSPQERTFGQIADGMADVSETIANKDLGEMAADVSEFARRNPLVFLGGAALIGFAATRFAKAGRPASGAHAQPDTTAPAYGERTYPAQQPTEYQPARNGGVS